MVVSIRKSVVILFHLLRNLIFERPRWEVSIWVSHRDKSKQIHSDPTVLFHQVVLSYNSFLDLRVYHPGFACFFIQGVIRIQIIMYYLIDISIALRFLLIEDATD